MTQKDQQKGEGESAIKNAHRVATPSDSETTAANHGNGQDNGHDNGRTTQERAKQALGVAEKEASVLLGEAKERLAPLDSWVKMTTREHPYLAVGSVLGAGFLGGIFMRRRTAVGLGITIGFLGGCLISGSGVRGAGQTRKT